MAKSGKGYLNLGLGQLVDLLLGIFLNWPLGGITRIMRGHVIAGILNLTIGLPLFWILDLITFTKTLFPNKITF